MRGGSVPEAEGAIVQGASGKSRVVSPRGLLVLTACIIAAALFAVGVTSGSAAAATGQKQLTIYSVATLAQFINHQDDRQRALGNNPFNKDTAKLVVSAQSGSGPFAGDDTVYSFTLYTGANLKKEAGTAVYTCHYNFAKHALCTAYYQLHGGTLLASGPVDFKGTTFTLALTGGTTKYVGSNGEVAMSPVSKNIQRLDFVLLGS
jgi:hypothetical protein